MADKNIRRYYIGITSIILTFVKQKKNMCGSQWQGYYRNKVKTKVNLINKLFKFNSLSLS